MFSHDTGNALYKPLYHHFVSFTKQCVSVHINLSIIFKLLEKHFAWKKCSV